MSSYSSNSRSPIGCGFSGKLSPTQYFWKRNASREDRDREERNERENRIRRRINERNQKRKEQERENRGIFAQKSLTKDTTLVLSPDEIRIKTEGRKDEIVHWKHIQTMGNVRKEVKDYFHEVRETV